MSTLPLPASAQSLKPSRTKRLLDLLNRGWGNFCQKLSAPVPSDHLDGGHSESGTGPSTAQTLRDPESSSLFSSSPNFEEEGLVNAVVVDNKGFRIYGTYESEDDHSEDSKQSEASQKPEAGSERPPSPREALRTVDFAKGSPHSDNMWTPIVRFVKWPFGSRFASLCDVQQSMEERYWRERWFNSKSLCILGSLWLVVVWILGAAFAKRPFNILDNIYFYLVCPVLILPLPVMVIYDFPRGGKSSIYQVWVTLAIWHPAIFNVIDTYLCGFFNAPRRLSCSDSDFFNIVYYACAIPAIGMFSLHQNRFPAVVGTTIFLGLLLGLVVPFRTNFLRHVAELAVFHVFLLYMNYSREVADRGIFTLKEQLKVQYKATQKAQVAERKSSDHRKRLTNYIFHEVRVPLNAATLAFQNLEASGVVKPDTALEFSALGGSLGMMSKVLSDILDFNRMDAGKLSSVERPYNFHRVLRSMVPGARVQAEVRGFAFKTEFDGNIDAVARRALYAEQGLNESQIEDKLNENVDDTVVVGDEMRLRQVITNLVSNAIKFNIPGPSSAVTLRTKLLQPPAAHPRPSVDKESVSGTVLNESQGSPVDETTSPQLDALVVRIEVEDKGVAIKPKDMVENRLFSPYVQTEIGRSQGGKGTGLGLALVRHIVALSGGRLGVISQKGVGSIFWVELALGIGSRAMRIPAWAEVIAESSPSLGSDWLRLPMPSPPPTTQNTPMFGPGQFGQTPSTLGPDPNSVNMPTDYIGPLDEHSAPSPASREKLNEPASRPLQSEVEKTSFGNGPGFAVPPQVPEEHEEASTPKLPAALTQLSPFSQTESNDDGMSSDDPANQGAQSMNRAAAMTRPPLKHSEPGTSSSSTKFGDSLNVLVVDDDGLTRRLMTRMLQRLGCNVVTAEDGLVALTLLVRGEKLTSAPVTPPDIEWTAPDDVMEREGYFHIVFLDNQMPHLSGVDMTKRLRGFGRRDLIVGVTGNATTEDQKEYVDAGADHVLTKPVREENLKAMLLLARSRSRSNSSRMNQPARSSGDPSPKSTLS